MNLLLLKGRMRVARGGLDLLRSKREALVREFLDVTDKAVATRDRMYDALSGAMNALSVAEGMDGRAAVESAAMASQREIPVELTERNVWGVRFPDIEYRTVVRAGDARNYALSGVSAHVSAAAREFEKSLDAVLKIISVEMRLKKIGGEIKKTTRRINAITEVVIPGLRRRIHTCRFALNEREREEIFRTKQFKEREQGVGSGE